jgi:hypothetical protein
LERLLRSDHPAQIGEQLTFVFCGLWATGLQQQQKKMLPAAIRSQSEPSWMSSWITKEKKVENEGNARVYDWTRAETEKSTMIEGTNDYEGNDQRNEVTTLKGEERNGKTIRLSHSTTHKSRAPLCETHRQQGFCLVLRYPYPP